MFTVFAVNKENDLHIGPDGNLAIVQGLKAIEQACEHAVKAQLGEMVLALTQGIPNFQVIWDGSPNIPQFAAAVRQAILNVPGVINIISFTTVEEKNTLNYAVSIQTIYGQGQVNANL